MADEFEPLTNDLILRTAWGNIPSLQLPPARTNTRDLGQDVERAPIWIMRQGMSDDGREATISAD